MRSSLFSLEIKLNLKIDKKKEILKCYESYYFRIAKRNHKSEYIIIKHGPIYLMILIEDVQLETLFNYHLLMNISPCGNQIWFTARYNNNYVVNKGNLMIKSAGFIWKFIRIGQFLLTVTLMNVLDGTLSSSFTSQNMEILVVVFSQMR